MFVAKLNSFGSGRRRRAAGGDGYDSGESLVLDPVGNVLVAGHFVGTAAFGSLTLMSAGEEDVFVARLSNAGAWQWVVRSGGVNANYAEGLGRDATGNLYLSGNFRAATDIGGVAIAGTGPTEIHGFVVKFSGALPIISSVLPLSGPVGTAVTVTGTNLLGCRGTGRAH